MAILHTFSTRSSPLSDADAPTVSAPTFSNLIRCVDCGHTQLFGENEERLALDFGSFHAIERLHDVRLWKRLPSLPIRARRRNTRSRLSFRWRQVIELNGIRLVK
jgi:hypothetical protein